MATQLAEACKDITVTSAPTSELSKEALNTVIRDFVMLWHNYGVIEAGIVKVRSCWARGGPHL